MNFLVICLHCLDMRDFHSEMRATPFLDVLRTRSVFIPMGRAQGHNQHDSLNPEMTGRWSARYCDSTLDEGGYHRPRNYWYPKTLPEYLQGAGYDIIPCIRGPARENMGTAALNGLRKRWLAGEPHRMSVFEDGQPGSVSELLERMHQARRFYAHVFVRDTHRPWHQPEGLGALLGKGTPSGWPEDAFCARKAALDCPDEFAALRRRGLARADSVVRTLVEGTSDIDNMVYLIYSNHGEVFDHYRYTLPYLNDGSCMVEGTSHGPYPYEALYSNMQMWMIPGQPPGVIRGIGRTIDIPATVLDLAGVEQPPMDGQSMLSSFNRGRFATRSRFAETGVGGALSMVREDGLKLVSTGLLDGNRAVDNVYGPAHHRLAVFDLEADPREYVNLIDTALGREVLSWAIANHASLKEEAPGHGPVSTGKSRGGASHL